MATKKVLIVILIVALVVPALAIQSSVLAQDDNPPQGLRPDAPPYAVHGPYAIGTRDLVVDPDSDRPLKVTVWYPALNPGGNEELIVYDDIDVKWDMPPEIVATVFGHALQDAAPDLSGGPYPLVIFSHGFTGFRQLYAYLTEHLASYGFVVIAPDHHEFWQADGGWAELWESSIERPSDIQQVIAFAEAQSAPGGSLEGWYDIGTIGVAGHSYGGYTTLAAAGARFNLNEFSARCAALPEDDPEQWLCAPFIPFTDDMAQIAGYDSMPSDPWPSWGDARIKAIVPLSGDSYLFGESGLADITIPMMAMVGTNDSSTPPNWGALPAYEFVSSQQKVLVVFEGAEHMVFQNACVEEPWIVDFGAFFFCSDPVWDMDRAHDLINHFTTAFLLATLKGDMDAAAALAPDAVQFPGVDYQAVGF